ncbi:diacylglycerol/polyprenol kinase family protein [Halobacteriovorax sp. HLS]|uniref:diacylglycerol/polyprenol kinase family protein n=1 Tax=Halobacteriovorax sp. HLS TaxID=2234000 RepID=UPI000FD9EB42|nr:diacylglycerol/polyprenol kinase family protein [Halobacteriovorax sp. HLS]
MNKENDTESSVESSTTTEAPKATATRHDLQFPRRFFHLSMGTGAGIIYYMFLTHQAAVSILGTAACLVYIVEQLRLNYPEHASTFSILTKYLLRAEEQLKESAGMPFVMGLLLTLLSFPKVVALTSIFTLAIADPMSAVIGIRFGKNRIVKGKSLEGSAAFFISTFLIIFGVFGFLFDNDMSLVTLLAIIVSLVMTAFEMLPIKLDDNLTIPIVMGLITWFCTGFLGIPTV